MSTNNSWNNQVDVANSNITLNAGTNTINISSDATNCTCNFGTGAGQKQVTVGSSVSASSLALRTGTIGMTLASNTGTIISATAAGDINYPLQPAFVAKTSGNISNVTGDGTVYTIIYDTVTSDQANNYDNTTGIFTAPVTGLYSFYAETGFSPVGTGTALGAAIITTNKNFYISGGLLKMDAADTAYVTVQIVGQAKTISVLGGIGFSGGLTY